LADIVQHGEVKLDDPTAKYAVRSLSRLAQDVHSEGAIPFPNKPGNEHRLAKEEDKISREI